jgi:hypothetical protein
MLSSKPHAARHRGRTASESRRMPSRKALLLRVGIDRGAGGALAPIFADGTFEYVPPPETVPTRCAATYATLPGRHLASLAAVLPARLAARHPHLDPDFRTATYGDAAPRKRRQLRRLAPDDLLVFYAGLAPWPPDDAPRIFAIGFFEVEQVHQLRSHDLGRADLVRRFGQTAHFFRRLPDPELVLVQGRHGASKLFRRAVPLADGRDCLLRDLASFGYQGSLLRAVGHWIRDEAGLQPLEAWLRAGPASLVDEATRPIPVAASALHPAGKRGDLVIDNERPRIGDWIVAFFEGGAAGVRALARINRIEPANGRRGAFSSLFWCGTGGAGFEGATVPPRLPDGSIVQEVSSIRRLISWFGAHYRIGLHGGLAPIQRGILLGAPLSQGRSSEG